jgi:Phage stabilisation protein
MQISILNGIYATNKSGIEVSYPENLMPVAKLIRENVTSGYLQPAPGLKSITNSSGVDRGGINWNNVCYRVIGNKLASLDSSGVLTYLGDVGGSISQVTFGYSFDRLAVASEGVFYFWNGVSLSRVTDPDLGRVIDFVWLDGYFVTTDGVSIVTTELNDSASVNPLKYGSAEADSDAIQALVRVRNEVFVVGRYTVEVFYNAGGAGFPLQRIPGAQIGRGAVGTHACCFAQIGGANGVVFLGGSKNSPASVWFGVNGNSSQISSESIDYELRQYSEQELSRAIMEYTDDGSHKKVYIHLPKKTFVYDASVSEFFREPVWYFLTSGTEKRGAYRARNFVWCYDKWIFGDPTSNKIGELDESQSSHFGERSYWEFRTGIIYNQSMGAIVHELELVCLPGNVEFNSAPVVTTSYSTDGELWSQSRARSAGNFGSRKSRINWLQQGCIRNWRIQRFFGDSTVHMPFLRLEARIEQLRV